MAEFVIIRNLKTGAQKTVSRETARLMPKNLLKVWEVVGEAPKKAGNAKAARAATMRESVLPEEIREMHAKAEHEARLKAESEMISGVAATGPAPQTEAAPASPAAPAQATEAPKQQEAAAAAGEKAAEENAPEVASLPNMGAKAAAALAAAGMGTFKALVDADATAINKVLDAAGLGAKRAQVPSWRTKAAEKAQAK